MPDVDTRALLARSAPDEDSAADLLAMWAEPEDREALVYAVDQSDYALEDWCEAALQMLRWLKTHQKTAKAIELTGYLSCCAQSQAGNPVRLPLAGVTEDMLAAYGFEAAGGGS
jgi:hypothetical protein